MRSHLLLPAVAATDVGAAPADVDQQQAGAAATVAAAAGASRCGDSSPRRSAGLRTSFAVWADGSSSTPDNNNSTIMAGSCDRLSLPATMTAGAELDPYPALTLAAAGNFGGDDSIVAQGAVAHGGRRGSAIHRHSSEKDMFSCGLVIQPSPKLLGLMEIHDRGSTAG